MSVRFKFKNDLDFQPIPCDGYHISVRDLKKSIIRRKKFGKVTDFDLVVTNAQNKQVYNDDDELIAKNTTLVVQRAPLGDGKKKVWEEELIPHDAPDIVSSSTGGGSFSSIPSLNLTQSSGDSEEDKILKMMSNSSEMYSEKHYVKYKGQRALPEGSKPPPHWKCSKCLGNHWVSDCPFANNDMKRTTGIPRSFLTPADSNVPGAKINPQGLIVVNEMEKKAYSEKKIEKNPWLLDEEKPTTDTKVTVPQELLCPICKELLKDAVMMPCCASSACDECGRNGIIESEGSKCPVCGEVANPEELIPYRLFRDKVDRFRNQTGYTKPVTQPPPVPSLVQSLAVKPTLPDIVLPDPTSHDFKFDALLGHRAAPGQPPVQPPNLNFTLTSAPPPIMNTVPPPIILSPARTPVADADTPADKTPGTPGTPTADSPRYEMLGPAKRSPHTPTSTPPRSPSTPRSPPRRSRSRSRDRSYSNDRRSPVPRKTPPPVAPAPVSVRPIVDTSVPPPMFKAGPPPVLLPHQLSHAPPPMYPPPPPPTHVVTYTQPPAPSHVINPSEDPLAAFEAAMRKLDSKKAGRGRSPPRAYQDRLRSRSRERYRDYYDGDRGGYDRGREYSPRRRSPGYYSPPRRGPVRRSPSPGSKGGLKRRFVADIPPETEQERRDRERYEREFAEREKRKRDDEFGDYRDREKVRVAPTPPREFLERENGGNLKSEHQENNRTPSLSPEPSNDRDKVKDNDDFDKDIKSETKLEDETESYPTKLPIIRDERDLDDKPYKDDDRDLRGKNERSDKYDRYRDKSKDRDRGHYDRSSRDRDRDRDREKYHRDSRSRRESSRDKHDRDRRDRDRYERRDDSHLRDRSRDRFRDDNREKLDRNRHERESSRDRHDEDKDRDEMESKDHERSLHNSTFEEDGSNKKSKKEKKAKKSKKKNKKKDRESDSEDEEKENKKKKKKDKKKKDKELDEKEAESDGEEADESTEIKQEEIPVEEKRSSLEESEEKTSPKLDVDSSKFINSFSEAVDDKPKHNLPTLVFNDKTVELAPKNGDSVETINNDLDNLNDEYNDSELLETGLSKWDKDEFYDETNKLSEPVTSQEVFKVQEDIPGPQSILKKALVNMEKDNIVREKKRKSLEGESEDKTEESYQRKKKKKRRESSNEDSSEKEDEEDNSRSKKKSKKKKKSELDIPEKTLKKLLKKNLLKKKALEKLLEDGGPKKKKKKRKSADYSADDKEKSVSKDSGNEKEERVVRRMSSKSKERSVNKDRISKHRQRHESEESREVKSSREGNLQIRVDNSTSTTKPKKMLTSTIEANLMKMSNGKGSEHTRSSPTRKSIKDRLGPVSDKSQSPNVRNSREKSLQNKKETVKDRLGRKEPEKKSRLSDNDSKIGGLPSNLKAWAQKTNKLDNLKGKSRSRSRDRDRRDKKGSPPARNTRRSRSRERRRSRSRSRSRDKRRRRSPSIDKKPARDRSRDRRHGKLNDNNQSPGKRRKNHRLASDKDRSFNSDSE